MAVPASKLFSELLGPSSLPFVGKRDRAARLQPYFFDSFVDGRDVLRFKMRVGYCDEARALLIKRHTDIMDQCDGGLFFDRDRPRKVDAEIGHAVSNRGEHKRLDSLYF